MRRLLVQLFPLFMVVSIMIAVAAMVGCPPVSSTQPSAPQLLAPADAAALIQSGIDDGLTVATVLYSQGKLTPAQFQLVQAAAAAGSKIAQQQSTGQPLTLAQALAIKHQVVQAILAVYLPGAATQP